MTFGSNVFLSLILIPAAIGICLSVLLLIALQKAHEKSGLKLRSYAVGYGVCVAINISVLIMTFGFALVPCYALMFGPLMIFSFMLNKKLIKETRLRNSIINFIYKTIITLLIWFMAFFPFSLFGITEIMNIPKQNTVKQEISQLQEEISKAETYADLTPFGLGIYKLQNEGDPLLGSPFLWDITQQKDGNISHGDIRIVYDYCRNLKSEETWDDSNRGKDVLYDVKLYEGTYIIIIPDTYYTYDTPRFYINLCKDISDNVDLFQVVVYSQETITKLQELSGEKLTRQELVEKLGKTKWESTPRQQ